MKHIKNFSLFENKNSVDYKHHPMSNYIIKKEEAEKLADAELENKAPGE